MVVISPKISTYSGKALLISGVINATYGLSRDTHSYVFPGLFRS